MHCSARAALELATHREIGRSDLAKPRLPRFAYMDPPSKEDRSRSLASTPTCRCTGHCTSRSRRSSPSCTSGRRRSRRCRSRRGS